MSSGCKRVEYVTEYVVVPDTTYRASYVMFTSLYDAWENVNGQSIALPDSVILNGQNVCHFARRYAQEARTYFGIRLGR